MVLIVFSSVFVSLTVVLNVIYNISSYQGEFKKCLLTPPVVFLLKTMSGLPLFKRMPTASSSCSSSLRCSSDFVASSMMRITSAVFAAVCKVRLPHRFNRPIKREGQLLTGNYLSATTTALACTLNDTRKIKKLDSGTFIFDYTRYCLKDS